MSQLTPRAVLIAAAIAQAGCGGGAKYHCIVMCFVGPGPQFETRQVDLEDVSENPCAEEPIRAACPDSLALPNCTCSPG